MGQNRDTAEAKAGGWLVTGNPDKWALLCKASNPGTGEYHSTKVLDLEDGSCVLSVDTRTPEGVFIGRLIHIPSRPA